MLNSTGRRDPERETALVGVQPSNAAVCLSPEISIMSYRATLTAEQAEPGKRPYNTTLRVPSNVWLDDASQEYPLNSDNVEAIVRHPDARSEYGFSLFEVHEIVEGSCIRYIAGRYVSFAAEEKYWPIDSVQICRIVRCLEQRGLTLRFAYDDETEIDYELNYQTLADYIMKKIDLPVLLQKITIDEENAA